MTRPAFFPLASLVAFFIFVGCASSPASKGSPEGVELIRAVVNQGGLKSLTDLERLAFTFNVERGDNDLERAWQYEPQSGTVTLTENGNEFTYNRQAQPLSDDAVAADKKFINDTYWLTFPYYALTADNEITAPESAKAPNRFAEQDDAVYQKVTVRFPTGGYTPGDAYDLYIDNSDRVRYWVFRRGMKPDGSAIQWAGYETFEGVEVSTERLNPAGDKRIWFSGIEVQR